VFENDSVVCSCGNYTRDGLPCLHIWALLDHFHDPSSAKSFPDLPRIWHKNLIHVRHFIAYDSSPEWSFIHGTVKPIEELEIHEKPAANTSESLPLQINCDSPRYDGFSFEDIHYSPPPSSPLAGVEVQNDETAATDQLHATIGHLHGIFQLLKRDDINAIENLNEHINSVVTLKEYIINYLAENTTLSLDDMATAPVISLDRNHVQKTSVADVTPWVMSSNGTSNKTVCSRVFRGSGERLRKQPPGRRQRDKKCGACGERGHIRTSRLCSRNVISGEIISSKQNLNKSCDDLPLMNPGPANTVRSLEEVRNQGNLVEVRLVGKFNNIYRAGPGTDRLSGVGSWTFITKCIYKGRTRSTILNNFDLQSLDILLEDSGVILSTGDNSRAPSKRQESQSKRARFV